MHIICVKIYLYHYIKYALRLQGHLSMSFSEWGQHFSIRWFSCMCSSLSTPHFMLLILSYLPDAINIFAMCSILPVTVGDYKAHSAHPNPWMPKSSVFKWSRIACGHAYPARCSGTSSSLLT